MNTKPEVDEVWLSRVLFLLAFSVFINYLDRGNLSTAAPLLKNEFQLSATQLGVLLSSFFWTYSFFLPLSGRMGRRSLHYLRRNSNPGSEHVYGRWARWGWDLACGLRSQRTRALGSMPAVAQDQTGGVAYLAHVGGFVFGALTGRLFEASSRMTEERSED